MKNDDLEIVGDDTEGPENGKSVVLKTSTGLNLFSFNTVLINKN